MFVMCPGSRSGAGFTLVEVLIAVLVLGLGLLGLAGLQTTSLRGTHSASLRIEAIQLSYEIADRIRANPSGEQAGNYNNQEGSSDDCLGSPCNAAQLAGYDLNQWRTAVSSRLPSGAGWVCRDSTPDDGNLYSPACDGNLPYAIKIWWDEDRTGDVFKYQQFTTSFQP